MREPEDLIPYLEAAAESSSRARGVLLVVTTISVLVFAAFWNSRLSSWQNSRLLMAQAAAQYAPWTPEVRARLSLADQGLFDESKAFAEERHLSTVDITTFEALLQRAQVENVLTFRVPVFGFTIDVNDLGMLGGFAFVVALMWLRFSLNRERDNLDVFFTEARREHVLKESYVLLAMRQVLTVPRLAGIEEQRFWEKLPAGLFALPVLSQGTVCIHDLLTFARGNTTNRANTIVQYVVEIFFLVLLVVLTGSCYSLSGKIEGHWDRAADELWPLSPKGSSGVPASRPVQS